MFRFSKLYFILTLLLLATEILIALYMHDRIIRPYVGDMLVVILIYCFLKSFLSLPVVPTAVGVLIFSCLVEVLQYLKLVRLLGLEKSVTANILIGNSFEWIDILAYTLGIALVIVFERKSSFRKTV